MPLIIMGSILVGRQKGGQQKMSLMRRCFFGGLLLAMLASGCGGVWAQETSLNDLKKWKDDFGFTQKDGVEFWDHPALVAALKGMMDKTHFETLHKEWSRQVTTMIQEKNGVLLATGCKEHACSTDNFRLFVDFNKQTVSVCWHQRDVENDMWFTSNAKPQEVGPTGCVAADRFSLYEKYGNK